MKNLGSISFTQIVTMFVLSYALSSCSRYRCERDGDNKVTIEYDERGYKVGDKIDCGFHTCTIVEVIGQPTPPPPVQPVNPPVFIPTVNGFPTPIKEIVWPEEIEAAGIGDELRGYIGADGVLYLQFNNVHHSKHH